jgi:hypothetical protein
VLAGCLRRGDLNLETALQIMNSAEDQMRGLEFSIPSAQVLSRVEDSTCSAYDCEFVVLAQDLAIPRHHRRETPEELPLRRPTTRLTPDSDRSCEW